MKTPTNRSAYMDTLRYDLEDVLVFGSFQRYYISRKFLFESEGRKYYADYTEEDAPQSIEFEPYGSNKKIRLDFNDGADHLMVYVNDEFRTHLSFGDYKSKSTFLAHVAILLDRYAR